MAVVGVVVGILFAKEVFGGFGRNFANPAIVGRAFIYVCFPLEMTGRFVPVFREWPGGFLRWSFESLEALPAALASAGSSVADAVTTATPMLARRDMGFVTPLEDLFLGTVGGVFPGEGGSRILAAGSIGEGCALLILLAGIYLLVTRTANWRLTLSTLAGAAAVNLFLHSVCGINEVPRIGFTLCSGALLYAAVFMVTDPVSAPKKPLAMFAYGGVIGLFIVLLRWRASFSGAVAFAILLGNICGPLFDLAAVELEKWKKRIRPEPGGGSS
jgi:Na+-transporting NADH:ubiquinone oxidoreductase subunit B